MARIKLFLMRHSKSCCNHIRHDANVANIPLSVRRRRGDGHVTARLSQKIRDPALSAEGRRVAVLYGPMLQRRLRDGGFDVEKAKILTSKLQRAKETAALVFGRSSYVIDNFTENGAIPENTPASTTYKKPSWPAVVKQLAALTKEGESVVAVGHGSYLGSLWPLLTGAPRKAKLNNLDGILLDITVSPSGRFVVHGHLDLQCLIQTKDRGDRCSVADTQKIAALSKMSRQSKNQRKSRKQRRSRSQSGGFATSMPLGFHQAGAQFAGTFAYPTGDQPVFPTEGNFIRAPLTQTQAGGFSPSVMGAFAENGARLLPMAGYMGYRMISNEKSQKKTRKHKRR
jgi:phosphohistidine phosphatase SixA